jgi:nucleoside-diphosphate-sugar epimerase
MKNKKIFITGSSGFIGKNMAIEFGNENEIFRFERGQTMSKTLKNFSPDIVLNCAGEIYDESKMFQSNVGIVQDILEYCEKKNVEHFVHLGSSAEYGAKQRAMSEGDKPSPRNRYEATKASATMLCKGHQDSNVTVIRPFSVFGRHEKKHRLFPRLLDYFLRGQELELSDGHHDFIYIKDFIRGVRLILEANKEESRGDTVNLGSGIQHSNLQVFEIFSKECSSPEKKVKLKVGYAKDFETGVWVCDTEYSRKKYGFQTEFSLEDGIMDLIKETKKYDN